MHIFGSSQEERAQSFGKLYKIIKYYNIILYHSFCKESNICGKTENFANIYGVKFGINHNLDMKLRINVTR